MHVATKSSQELDRNGLAFEESAQGQRVKGP